MTKPTSMLVVTLAATVFVLGQPVRRLEAQGPGQGLAYGQPEWVAAIRHDTSRPLREMVPTPAISTRGDFEVKQPAPAPQAAVSDGALQPFIVSALAATSGLGFDGVGEGNPQFSYNVNSAPPDTVGEAGDTQFVQWVNTSFAVFDKATGTKIYGPAGGNTIWSGFGGPCETRNDGDPIVQYDQLANRWVMTQFAVPSGSYMQCVAISQTSDATGAWHRYAFAKSEFPDYPKLAIWPDGYYITYNMFGQFFTGSLICAYDRAKMLSGLPATEICHKLSTQYHSFLASDLEGTALPPAGTPNYVLSRGSSSLNVFKFTPNFANGTSTFTGPTSVPVAPYTLACSRNCVPQPGTSQTLDALGDRLMYRLTYRNLGTREAMVVNHSVAVNGVIGVRWYELNVSNGTVSVRQQSTYAPADGQYRWMGSVGMDKVGNIGIGFSIGSSTQRPSIRFAGRAVTDPLNNLSLDESMHVGTGSQLANLSRWGDYSSMTIDPGDDCTFWFTSEYLQTNGTFNWSTRIGSFKFADCGGAPPPPTPTVSLGASPSSRSVVQGQSTTFSATVTPLNGYTGSGSFSVSGTPAGSSASFSNPSYSGGSGSTTLTITTFPETPLSSGQVTITATDTNGTPTQSTTVTLNVTAAPNPDFTISASPATKTVKRPKSGTYVVTVTALDGFGENVALSVTGLPAGANGSFSPASLPGGGQSTLTITTTPQTLRGTYDLTITGTSPSKSRSATVTLKIN
jgi:hypothetical protein